MTTGPRDTWATWGEIMGSSGPEAPTREEAVQTLLGVARILNGGSGEALEPRADLREQELAPVEEAGPGGEEGRAAAEENDPDQLSFEFAKGYDEGYQMGRRVGLALGARKRSS